MSVWAITMVKDEADVIEPVLRHVAAQGVEGIIVADNGSTDGTREIIRDVQASIGVPLHIQHDAEVGYYQSRKMSVLAARAAEWGGAEWIWPFDADELWYIGEPPLQVAGHVQHLGREHPDVHVLQSRLWHHFPTALDADEGNPFERMRYRAGDEAPIGKVIVRWRLGSNIHQGNHGATIAGLGPTDGILHTDIQVRHFPYRSPEQFVSKAVNGAAAYAATDLDWSIGQHWREYGLHYEQGGPERLRRIYREHFFYDLPSAAGLVYDPARLDG